MNPASVEDVEVIVSERLAELERRLAPEALSLRDVAKRLNLSVRRIRELIASGELPSYKIGRLRRVDPSALAAYLAERQRPAPTAPRKAPTISGGNWLQEFQRRAYGG